jgi:hypothetical protein
MWNFSDPEFPTNKKIIDPFTWYKNYKVKTITAKISTGGIGADDDVVVEDTANSLSEVGVNNKFNYRKVINTFTYKEGNLIDDLDEGKYLKDVKILTPEDKKYKKYSESNGEFGASKINRPDLNAIGLGH